MTNGKNPVLSALNSMSKVKNKLLSLMISFQQFMNHLSLQNQLKRKKFGHNS